MPSPPDPPPKWNSDQGPTREAGQVLAPKGTPIQRAMRQGRVSAQRKLFSQWLRLQHPRLPHNVLAASCPSEGELAARTTILPP